VTFDIDGLRFGLLLGMEVHFPELFIEYERLDVDCVLFSTVVSGAQGLERGNAGRFGKGRDSRCRQCGQVQRRQHCVLPDGGVGDVVAIRVLVGEVGRYPLDCGTARFFRPLRS
jgi:hypothetical protein